MGEMHALSVSLEPLWGMRLTGVLMGSRSCPVPTSSLIPYVTDHALPHCPTCSCSQHSSSSSFNSNFLNSSPLAIAILVSSFDLWPHALACPFPSVHFPVSICGSRVSSSPLFSPPTPLIRCPLIIHTQMSPGITLSAVQTPSSWWILEREELKEQERVHR